MAHLTDQISDQPGFVRLRKIPGEDPTDGWDKAWQSKVTPWDLGEAQPPLRSLLASGVLELQKDSGKALVPGCGRAYDAITIATTLGYETLAIDISTAALKAARNLVTSSNEPASAKVRVELKEFFKEGGKYDLVYDYTFFVALPPSRRAEWGRQMSALVRPGGYLIALLWPIIEQPPHKGPPYRARPEDYAAVLGAGWNKVVDEEPEDSLPAHKGIERLLVWQRL